MSEVPFPIPLVFEGGFSMPQRTIRFSAKANQQISEAARRRGFSSASAFIRYSVDRELSDRQEEILGVEERVAATLDQMRRDSFRLHRAQQALFALFDTFAKAVLTCMPEPLPDVKAQA
jgi:Arc/MetJ-type ribon-helix-helix transcriptional regulator